MSPCTASVGRMTNDVTPNQTGERESLASFLRVLAGDVAAGAPRPYSINFPTTGAAKMQIWPEHSDRETGVALWGRVLGATSVRVEHGWGSSGAVHYSVSGEYGDGWTLEVWTTGDPEPAERATSYVPVSVFLDRLEPADEALELPTSTPVAWTEPGRAVDEARAFDDPPPAMTTTDVARLYDVPAELLEYRPDETDWRRYEGRD